MPLELEEIHALAEQAARAASEVLLRYYGRPEIQHKGESQNIVTQADVESEEAIIRLVQRQYPDHQFLREEGVSTGDAASEHLWIVDPLDGTTNYAHGIPQFSTSIAYARDGEVQLGVVFDPMRKEMFSAIQGQGARLNGQQIRVSPRSNLADAVVATGFYYDRGVMMRRTLSAIESLFERNVRGVRRFGGAALDQCWVACGRFDGFFEYQLAPWDYAAASLIVTEAGGRCADRDGGPLRLDAGSLIAANRALFDDLREIVKW